MADQKNRALFGILFLIFIFFVILMVFAAYTVNVLQRESSSFKSKESSIAVVEVEGIVLDSKKIVSLLKKAANDKETKALIVRINSPGGAVGPCQEIYEEIRRIDEEYSSSKGEKGRPVYASFGSIAASGGYYIGAAARKIYSNPGGLTGSIGVIINTTDLSELYRWAKIKPNPLTAGRFKDAGRGHRPLTEKERKMFRSTLEGVRQQFIRHILQTRKGRIRGEIQELAQGQLFSGEEAQKVGLVDELAGLWTAGRRIHEELKLKGEFGFKFIREKKKKGLWKVLDQLDGAETRLDILREFARKVFPQTPLFLSPHLSLDSLETL